MKKIIGITLVAAVCLAAMTAAPKKLKLKQ